MSSTIFFFCFFGTLLTVINVTILHISIFIVVIYKRFLLISRVIPSVNVIII